MCQIQAMSDAELLALMVGPKTAQEMLKKSSGSLAALLNESIAAYNPKPSPTSTVRFGAEGFFAVVAVLQQPVSL